MKTIKDILWEIKYYFKKFYINVIYFFEGIYRIFYWLPVIFKDKDYDFSYMYKILRFKMNSMANYFEKSTWVESNSNTAKQIRFCVRILDRLIEDNYIHPDYDAYIDKRFNLIKDGKIGDSISVGPDMSDRVPSDYETWIAWEMHRKNRDEMLLFKMLEKYSQEWWD